MVRLARIFFALLALAAVVYQFADSSSNGFSEISFFSFFTIQCNLIAIGVLSYGGLASGASESALFQGVRGAATVYMAIVGIVFALLLSGYQEELQTVTPWVNTVVHELIPVVMVADWLIFPPRVPISLRTAAWWLAYPLAYLAYTLTRGPIADWYPYPFLDHRIDGAGTVALHCLGILIAMVVVGYATMAIGNELRRRRYA